MRRSEKLKKMERKSDFQWMVKELKSQFPEWKGFIDQFTNSIKPVWFGNHSRFQTHFIHLFGIGFKEDWERIFSAFLTLSNWSDSTFLFTLRKGTIPEDWDKFVQESTENKMPQLLYVEDGFNLLNCTKEQREDLQFTNTNLTSDDQRILSARNWYVKKKDLRIDKGKTVQTIPSSGTLVISWFELGVTLSEKISTFKNLDFWYNFNLYEMDLALKRYVIDKLNFKYFRDQGIVRFMEDRNSPFHFFEAILNSEYEINYLLGEKENVNTYPGDFLYRFFICDIEKVPDDLEEFTRQMTREALSRSEFLIEVMKFTAIGSLTKGFSFQKERERNYDRCEIYFSGFRENAPNFNVYEFPVGSLEELFIKMDQVE